MAKCLTHNQRDRAIQTSDQRPFFAIFHGISPKVLLEISHDITIISPFIYIIFPKKPYHVMW